MDNSTTTPEEPQIEWRLIPGYEDRYQVSNTGLVRSLNPGRHLRADRVLSSPLVHGYPYVRLRQDGQYKNFRVHQLVMSAFAGKCPKGMEINHINGIKHDNRLSNLEYVTHQQNIRHAVATGLMRGKSWKHVE